MEKYELEIKNLNLSIDNNSILENINLKIKKGEIHCLIGPNGGGKSSLIKCILKELNFQGDITFQNNHKNIIGYLPQHINLNNSIPLTVNEFISINSQTSPCFLVFDFKKQRQVDNLLKKFKLYDKRNSIFTTLSGGERQRVLLLQSLLPTPNFLILDEPLTGMDKHGEDFFISLIKELKEQGITILWIEHNLYKVKKFADTVTCINKTNIACNLLDSNFFEKEISNIFCR